MIPMRNGALQPQAEGDAGELERQQRQREGGEGQQDGYGADHEDSSLGLDRRGDRAAPYATQRDSTKKCGPGQTRRLTGTAGGA